MQRSVKNQTCSCGLPALAHYADGPAMCRRCYNTAYHNHRYQSEPDFRRRHIASVTRWKQRSRYAAVRELAGLIRAAQNRQEVVA